MITYYLIITTAATKATMMMMLWFLISPRTYSCLYNLPMNKSAFLWFLTGIGEQNLKMHADELSFHQQEQFPDRNCFIIYCCASQCKIHLKSKSQSTQASFWLQVLLYINGIP